MLNLMNYLTEEDNEKIKNYITTYGIDKEYYIGNEEYLKYWAECNKRLFHLLGGKLIHKIPVKVSMPKDVLIREFNKNDFCSVFLFKLKCSIARIINQQGFCASAAISPLFLVENIFNDKLHFKQTLKISNNEGKKPLQLQNTLKPIRAIQKIINYYEELDKYKEDFETFKIEFSKIVNQRELEGNLCFSIHPLDFMTMSDNNCDWSSCMSWKKKGCYRVGTVEMMNSNNVICCYLESSKSWQFCDLEENNTWNSKKWRQLFYITKEIAVSGKPYPYDSNELTMLALDEIKRLTEKNTKRTYTYGPEPYKDMIHLGSMHRMERNRNFIKANLTKKRNIIFDTKGMYNDMFNDNENENYLCYRNKVKKNTIICVSGKSPCLCCGNETLRHGNYDGFTQDDYNDRYYSTDSLICNDCNEEHFLCSFCSDKCASDGYIINGKRYCEYCLKEMYICPCCGKETPPISSIYNLYDKSYPYIRISCEKITLRDLYKREPSVLLPIPVCGECLSNINGNNRIEDYEFEEVHLSKESPEEVPSWYPEADILITKEVIDIDNNEYFNKFLFKNLIKYKDYLKD